jgi:C-terminal processing protease CtpA/Prc
LFIFFNQEHGAAYEAGGLEVGQLILEVDGNKVDGMHHQVSL